MSFLLLMLMFLLTVLQLLMPMVEVALKKNLLLILQLQWLVLDFLQLMVHLLFPSHDRNGTHNGVAKLKVQSPDSANYGGTVSTNPPARGGGRDQNVIGTQWAINAAMKWVEFQSQKPDAETLNHVAYYARELMKMRDNIESYKIDSKVPTDLPF